MWDDDAIIDWDLDWFEERARTAAERDKHDPVLNLAVQAITGEISNREYLRRVRELDEID